MAVWRRRQLWRSPAALPGPPSWGPSSLPFLTSSHQLKTVGGGGSSATTHAELRKYGSRSDQYGALSASSGSDSPDQAMEAEEIVKQLDMEQSVETPTSTATSTQDLSATSNFNSSVSQLPPLRPPHIPEASLLAVEEELDADLPPLTGRWRGSERCWRLPRSPLMPMLLVGL